MRRRFFPDRNNIVFLVRAKPPPRIFHCKCHLLWLLLLRKGLLQTYSTHCFQSELLGGLCPGASKLKCKSGASFGVHLVGQEITKDELARLKGQRSDLRKAMRENRKAAKNAAKRKKRLVKALSMQIYAVQRNLGGSRLYCLLAKTGLWSLRKANVSSVSKRQSARLKDTENKCELDVFKQFGTK